MKPLNIILISFEYPPYPLAGTGMYAFNLINYLKTDYKEQYKITLLTPKHDATSLDYEVIDNLTIYRLPLQKKITLAKENRSFLDKHTLFAKKANAFLKSGTLDLTKYDLLHSITLRDAAFLDHTYLHSYFPTIVSINDYYIVGSSWNPFKFHFKSTDMPIRYLHHNLIKYLYVRTLRGATFIIPNCKYAANLLTKKYALPQEKMHVVYRGINIPKYDVPIPKDKYQKKTVLFIGANMERKGAIYLVKAAPKILEKFPETKFILVGSASFLYKKMIRNFVQKNNLAQSFEFKDYLDPKEVPLYLQNANVFVMPPIIEQLAQAYMEAMMTATPVVGTNVGGQPELITSKEGYLVAPKDPAAISDAVIDLFSNPRKAQEMGRLGREKISSFWNLPRMLKDTLNVYQLAAKSK